MRDRFLRQVIEGNVNAVTGWRRTALTAAVFFAAGIGVAVLCVSYTAPRFSDDDLATLAELAACSTGEPGAALWFQARDAQGWMPPFGNYGLAKRFLVQIDVRRCGVGQTAHTYVDQRKVAAVPPGQRDD